MEAMPREKRHGCPDCQIVQDSSLKRLWEDKADPFLVIQTPSELIVLNKRHSLAIPKDAVGVMATSTPSLQGIQAIGRGGRSL
jgi:hypothetical protein